jgi:hypothetical protein
MHLRCFDSREPGGRLVRSAESGAFVRTWGSPIGTEPGLSYLGPELDLAILKANVTLGVLWRVSGSGGKSVLFSWGVGVVL